MPDKTEKYRAIGFKLTPQRIAILDYLAGNKEHPSAEDIYNAVAERFPTISLATVYSTMASLKQLGKVAEVTIDQSRKRFDPLTRQHDHLICVSCGHIFDVEATSRPVLMGEAAKQFTVLESHLEIYGLCGGCDKKSVNTTKEDNDVRRS